MELTDALIRVGEVIHLGSRHPFYGRATELADLYRKLVTGDNLSSLLRQFVLRESDEAFKQRERITSHVITTTVKNLMDVVKKVPRANYQRRLQAESTKSADEIELALSTFWGDQSVDDYVKTRWVEMNGIDPNAFSVVEFDPFDNNVERAKPYPFEVSAHDAVDFKVDNNTLQYLISRSHFAMPMKDAPNNIGEKLTVYLKNQTFSLKERPERYGKQNLEIENGSFYYDAELPSIFRSGERLFDITYPTPHDLGHVPAKRFGYLRDMWTNGNTFVAPYDPSVPLLLKSIKVNSEMDLTMAFSAFPLRIEYAPKCDALDCFNGRTNDGTAICSSCNGSGHKSVTSAQEKLVLTLPKPGSEMYDLEKLIAFKSPPVDILTFQQQYVEAMTAACKSAMFNSDIFTRQQVAETATSKRIDLDNVYDTLFDCALGMGSIWAFLVKTSAGFMSLDKGLVAELVFAKDFKMKGLADLLADLESANRSGAGPEVIRSIQNDIARLLYADDPLSLVRFTTKARINPFSGYSEKQIAISLSDANVPQRYKTLYLMLGVIFDELEAEAVSAGKDFYMYTPKEQKRLIDEKVTGYINESAARPSLV